jgi:hypothetical protein
MPQEKNVQVPKTLATRLAKVAKELDLPPEKVLEMALIDFMRIHEAAVEIDGEDERKRTKRR